MIGLKVVGIIAEYNPFHHGHAYQLTQVKKTYQPDVLIVVMSGNVVQRGEFAILDKWQRAQIALNHGVDLIVELPLLASLQSADYFAKESIQLLSRLQCQRVIFGTEEAQTKELAQLHHWTERNRECIDGMIQNYLKKGHSYAYAYQATLDSLQAPLTFNASMSNHILGLQYICWNEQLDHPMTLDALPRVKKFEDQWVLSGSQIRSLWHSNQLEKEQVPLETWEILQHSATVDWSHYWPFLQYRLLSDSNDSLQEIVGMKEGIERRLKEYAFSFTFNEFIDQLTSKRWSKASLQRICMATLLNLTKASWQREKEKQNQHTVARVLGFNDRGRLYLNRLKKEKQLALFTNLNRSLEPYYQLMLQTDRIYQLNNYAKLNEQIIGRYGIYKT